MANAEFEANPTIDLTMEVSMSSGAGDYSAEAWAVGQRGGVNVSQDDETYHNNAKYWAQNANAAGTVRYNQSQSLTDTEKTRARSNIGAAAAADVPTGTVQYDEAQSLTDTEKAQARSNIGAAAAADVPTGTVQYDEAQTLTESQKAQARTNIGAAGPDIHALETLHNVVSYGQDANPVNADAQKRVGMIITLSNTFEATTTPAWLKFSNAYAWGGNENMIKGWTGALTLTQNHRYRLSVHYLSGTYTRTTAGAPIIAIACVAGTAVTIPGVVFDGDTDSHVEFDCSGDAYTNGVHLVVGIRRNSTNAVTLTDYTFALVLQDITDMAGFVQYNAAQTLTDTQKAQALANVRAVDAVDFNHVNFLVDYNSEATVQTTTHEGISITRRGTRLTLNGTNETGGLIRVRMCGSLYACTGNISGTGLNAPAIVLQRGHSYILNTRLVSGSVSGDADREYTVFTSAMIKSTGGNYAGATGNLLTTAGGQRRLYVGDGTTQVLIVFGCFNNTEFTNATYEVTLEDITVESDWNYPLMVSRGNANFFGNGYGPESIGVDAALTYNGATVDFIGGQALYHGTYYASNASTYFSVSNGIQTQGGSAKDAFLHPNTLLKAGRKYKIAATVLSGSVTGGSETLQPALQFYYKYSGVGIQTSRFTDTLISDLTGASYPVRYEKFMTPGADTQIGFGIWMRSPGASYKEVYSNLRVVYTIEDVTDTITDSSATPTITAVSGMRYVCSATAVTELAFTPSANGICSVRFKSGSTATVLTLPSAVKMPDWWTGPEANRTYEISIEDGVYGVVTSWA